MTRIDRVTFCDVTVPVSYRKLRGASGKYRYRKGPRVLIERGLEPDPMARAILHETLHAISEHLGLKLSERDVRGLETSLVSLIRRNGELVDAIRRSE